MTFLEAIQALGETPEQVTAKLSEMGIKGYRQMASSCPVAKYLNACGFPHVTVGSTANLYQDADKHYSDQCHHLPAGVKQWICDFDDGKYPEFYLE